MLGLLVVIVAIDSALFHELMEHEGQDYSWITAGHRNALRRAGVRRSR